ncbi:serine/arginine-rich splicing factor RS2Z33-like [Nylanderia fulva]|uniref:serine/arginine-rich splicing factor RS2Z33-like n=1 Tax=Nylanderia fulva TaxID=613905 RepID=UPI0010FB87A2|nr:serine/arginine-rich splicing factor RS2Z33-like [Nylanderia fulva]
MLEARPLQCYKCLEGGHVRARCPNNTDRSGRCYRCGEKGHAARNCTADVKCPVCADKGLPANHRAGGKACTPVHKGKRGVPLNKVMEHPRGTAQMTVPVAPLMSLEELKEQRALRSRTRGEKREEEKLPMKGGRKKKRLQEDLKEGNPAAMDTTGPAEAAAREDGL